MISPIYEQLFRAGYMIVSREMQHDCEEYTVWGIMKSGDVPPKEWHTPYSLVVKAATDLIMQINGPAEVGFSVCVRYHRGLGYESINIDSIKDISYASAKEKARSQAEEYFSKTPGFEKAKIADVHLRPVTLV